MQLTPDQIAAIVAAGKDDVVFISLEPGIQPSAFQKTADAVMAHANEVRAKGEFFPRVLVLPPGMRVDVVRQPQAVQNAVRKAARAATPNLR
jgi:CRISPR/Cas system-associated protein Csm6